MGESNCRVIIKCHGKCIRSCDEKEFESFLGINNEDREIAMWLKKLLKKAI